MASLDGKRLIRDIKKGSVSSAEEIGIDLANELKGRGAGAVSYTHLTLPTIYSV